ncbi:HAD family hydrolase [Desulfovibrio mangrovi]|uniref:HAD family hydrolase n=1 Tax=Desulfovibrio mangrovi TaxID=2976983 RepID=UPI002247381C|nr:HAD family hydrolase [Desulfovibrio mangrovi]UZP67883.1 HAD family hydrolase [Desulfovibrio mangrovi]
MKDRAVLFDWGGTLMTSMPYYMGAGRGWSAVPAVEGALETVRALSASWTIGLASNASESDEDEVRTALDTIGLGSLMDRIYTYRRVGRPKPWPDFWRYVLSDLGLQPSRVVMVGDNYMDDVWGASNVGMHAVWLNLDSADVRTGERYRTIHSFAELPGALSEMGFV